MKSMQSQGSSAVLFMMTVMVWHIVSNAHKFVTTLILVMLVLLELTDNFLESVALQFSLQPHRYD